MCCVCAIAFRLDFTSSQIIICHCSWLCVKWSPVYVCRPDVEKPLHIYNHTMHQLPCIIFCPLKMPLDDGGTLRTQLKWWEKLFKLQQVHAFTTTCFKSEVTKSYSHFWIPTQKLCVATFKHVHCVHVWQSQFGARHF